MGRKPLRRWMMGANWCSDRKLGLPLGNSRSVRQSWGRPDKNVYRALWELWWADCGNGSRLMMVSMRLTVVELLRPSADSCHLSSGAPSANSFLPCFYFGQFSFRKTTPIYLRKLSAIILGRQMVIEGAPFEFSVNAFCCHRNVVDFLLPLNFSAIIFLLLSYFNDKFYYYSKFN